MEETKCLKPFGYKVDRLTRSLADFTRLVEIFDAQGVSFVSVTQPFRLQIRLRGMAVLHRLADRERRLR